MSFRARWSTDGCYINTTNSTHTVCHCYHLTSFAVLMSVKGDTSALVQVSTVCLSVLHALVCLTVCPYAYLCICVSIIVCLSSVCLSVRLSIGQSVCLSISFLLSVCLSVRPACVCLSLHLFTCLSVVRPFVWGDTLITRKVIRVLVLTNMVAFLRRADTSSL